MKITGDFHLEEFIPKGVYRIYGASSAKFIDIRVIETAQALRTFFGVPITINNWKWNGTRNNSGFRAANSKVGSRFSQHRFGRAADLLFKGLLAEEVRKVILENQSAFPHIRRMENKVSWLHFDLAYTGKKEIICFDP